MNVLFEDQNQLKAGTVLLETDQALQIEMPTGKRAKIKRTQVLLQFQQPSAKDILNEAQVLAQEIAPDFLWECLDEGEFSFEDCAADYFGKTPSATESLAVLLACQAAPIYFHRKGKGRFKKAPEEILQKALQSQAKKELEKEQIKEWVEELKNGTVPEEMLKERDAILFSKNRQNKSVKAFDLLIEETKESPDAAALRLKIYPNAYLLHWARFIFNELGGHLSDFPQKEWTLSTPDWAFSTVNAFSIDDLSTTEIDDAFSVQFLENQNVIGIHIAAPSAAFSLDSPLNAQALSRLSTLYLPGEKRTMLPNAVVEHCTLNQNKEAPALSLYLTVDSDFHVLSFENKLEKITVKENLRIQHLEPFFNENTLPNLKTDFPFAKELLFLWRFATEQNALRGKNNHAGKSDFNFEVTGNLSIPESCSIQITPRERGSPIDLLVSELMILANAFWGKTLAEKNIAGIFRAQTTGRAYFSTKALPHEGLGVEHYLWATAPLRRYSDLINQRQLVALLENQKPPFSAQSAELFGALRNFEATYNAYAEFERVMERFWSLEYLRQNAPERLKAVVYKENAVRLTDFPLFPKVFNLPNGLELGIFVWLTIESLDFITLSFNAKFLAKIDESKDFYE